MSSLQHTTTTGVPTVCSHYVLYNIMTFVIRGRPPACVQITQVGTTRVVLTCDFLYPHYQKCFYTHIITHTQRLFCRLITCTNIHVLCTYITQLLLVCDGIDEYSTGNRYISPAPGRGGYMTLTMSVICIYLSIECSITLDMRSKTQFGVLVFHNTLTL